MFMLAESVRQSEHTATSIHPSIYPFIHPSIYRWNWTRTQHRGRRKKENGTRAGEGFSTICYAILHTWPLNAAIGSSLHSNEADGQGWARTPPAQAQAKKKQYKSQAIVGQLDEVWMITPDREADSGSERERANACSSLSTLKRCSWL